MHRNRLRGLFAVAALAFLAAAPATAQQPPDYAAVLFVPANSNPPLPPGMKVTCLRTPDNGAPSQTCPVVVYQGITTWAFSFLDNRVAMAMVSYDASNKIVRSVNHDGARYVWNMISSLHTKTVLVEGQSNANFTVNWSDLGKP